MSSEDIVEIVNRYLLSHTDFLKVKDKLTEDQLRIFVDKAIDDLCQVQQIKISFEIKSLLIRNLVSAIVSLGPLRPLMEDKNITEIMVNGPDKIYIQQKGHIVKTDIKFDDTRHLTHTIQKILATSKANKRLDESSPYADFSLPDGSRVNVILPPCSSIGPVMTIRKFKDDIGTVEDLINLGMLNKEIATLLIAAMKGKLNVIFCGSTGAGKTTALNVFSRHIPSHERVITIEDTPELILLQEHVVSLSTKSANIEGKGEITMRDLFINSLRMRPDRIIIGEVRGAEMLDLIQSISSGHSGSLAIVHAETPEDCFNRMVTMMLMTGIRLSTEEIQKQVARAVDIIVHIELFLDGVRRVNYVTEVLFDDHTKKTSMHDIFRFNQKHLGADGRLVGEWIMNKKKPLFMDKLTKRMVQLPEGFFETK
jgi:pilus assembly protein CpaF